MSIEPTPLEPGDRVANFTLPGTDGRARMFYTSVTGRPIVLFVCNGLHIPGQAKALAGIARLHAAIDEAGAQVFAVSSDDPDSNRARAAALGVEFPVFSDARGQVRPFLLTTRAASRPGGRREEASYRTLILDPNQRILDIVKAGDADAHGPRVLELLRSWRRPGLGAGARETVAPVLFIPNVFASSFCRELIHRWHTGGHEEGGDLGGYGDGVTQVGKKTLDHQILDENLQERINVVFERRVLPEMGKVFRFNPRAFYFDRHIILSYQSERQDFFAAHRDNFTPETRDRLFAISLNLNDDFDGGELYFPEYDPNPYRLAAGTACVFSCALLHEAKPVTRGQRFALTSFIWRGPVSGQAPLR